MLAGVDVQELRGDDDLAEQVAAHFAEVEKELTALVTDAKLGQRRVRLIDISAA